MERFEAKLHSLREELQASLRALQQDSAPVTLDQNRVGRLSRMDAIQGQQMASEHLRRAQLQLKKIEAALQRIAAGEFGRCIDCDETIAEGRLEADPTALRCISCAEQQVRN